MTFTFQDLYIEPLVGLMRSPEWILGRMEIDDKSYLTFLGKSLNVDRVWAGKKKFYFDLGSADYPSSLGWIRRFYPVFFDHIYSWDNGHQIEIPSAESLEREMGSLEKAQRYIRSINHTVKAVGFADNEFTIDVGAIIRRVTRPEDFVVVKMDIEGMEWDTIPHFVRTGVFDHIDEFFVEIHFSHPDMVNYGWNGFLEHPSWTLEAAKKMIQDLRDKGIYAHYWP